MIVKNPIGELYFKYSPGNKEMFSERAVSDIVQHSVKMNRTIDVNDFISGKIMKSMENLLK